MNIKKFDWKSITAALFALGIVSTQDSMLAAISLTATVLVMVLNAFAGSFKVVLNRSWLTVVLYFVALFLAVAFQPQSLPAWPVWGGEPSLYGELIAAWLVAAAPLAGLITGSATVIYNVLLPLVIDPLKKFLPA